MKKRAGNQTQASFNYTEAFQEYAAMVVTKERDPKRRAELARMLKIGSARTFVQGARRAIVELYTPPPEERPYRKLLSAIFPQEGGRAIPEDALQNVLTGVYTGLDAPPENAAAFQDQLLKEAIWQNKNLVKTEWPEGALELIEMALDGLPENAATAIRSKYRLPSAHWSKEALTSNQHYTWSKRGIKRLQRGSFRQALWCLTAWTIEQREYTITPYLIYGEALKVLTPKEAPLQFIQLLADPVTALGLSEGALNALMLGAYDGNDIRYVYQLLDHTEAALANRRRVGRRAMAEIKAALEGKGLEFGKVPKELVPIFDQHLRPGN